MSISISTGRPWHITAGNSNLGQEQTDLSKTSTSIRFDNLFDLNDLLSFSYEHNGPDYLGNSDGFGESDSYSGSLSIP